ncbi:MAG: hypothetical protein Q9208_005641 [Pyrenodesmia sp. 3 TL-2023]
MIQCANIQARLEKGESLAVLSLGPRAPQIRLHETAVSVTLRYRFEMEDHPICVVDAGTLVEHIHEIKRFVYQGRLRLVVPQRISKPLEQKFASLSEDAIKKQKPSKPEPQRPRSSGRLAKVEKSSKAETSTVDINPLVAGEFLSRFRSDETQKQVEFQSESEQYSQWRLLELEEESKKANENKPTSFAQAARKASMEAFSSATGAANGPAKPRLVARSAGVDGSPWKKSNKALSLPISEVPKETRPVLSSVLWRIHEKGATLWDTNRTFLLCENEKTNALAKKLGIVTKSVVELRKLCNEKETTERRETFGELEAHFNLPEIVKAAPLVNAEDSAKLKPAITTVDQSLEDTVAINTAPDQAKSSGPSSNSQGVTQSVKSTHSSKLQESTGLEQHHDHEVLKHRAESPEPRGRASVGIPAPSTSGHDDGGLPHATPAIATGGDLNEASAKSDQAVVHPSQPIFKPLAFEKEHSIAEWVKGLMDAASNSELSGRDTPVSGRSPSMDNIAANADPEKPFKPLTYRQAVTGKADEVIKRPLSAPRDILPSPIASPARESSPPKFDDPLDSEEEMIVFSPKAKRLSTQKAQHAQKQSSPPAPQPTRATQATPVPVVQQVQRPQTPKSSPRHGHGRNVSGGRSHIRGGVQRQPRPGPPPVIIDPDSFGRGLATNPQPTVARTFSPYGAHGRVANERRGNRPSAPHHITPPKLNGAAMASGTANTTTTTQAASDQIPTATGPALAEAIPAVQGPHVTTPPSLLKPSPMVNGSSAESSAPGLSPVVSGFQVQSQNHQAVPLRAERPRYSPRGSPRRMPIMPEPEVGYILKSGQPREATRGRGKLWVP